jgi:hypothetical protein
LHLISDWTSILLTVTRLGLEEGGGRQENTTPPSKAGGETRAPNMSASQAAAGGGGASGGKGGNALGVDNSPSKSTVEKAKLTKMLIESHYTNLAKEKDERIQR